MVYVTSKIDEVLTESVEARCRGRAQRLEVRGSVRAEIAHLTLKSGYPRLEIVGLHDPSLMRHRLPASSYPQRIYLDRRRVLFFGEPLMVEMNERRALMDVLATVWPGYEICWAYDGTEELAGYVGAAAAARYLGQAADAEARPRPKPHVPPHLCGRRRRQLRFWPLWWHLSKAWHGPALLDKLPGPGIRRIRLGKIPEGGAHIDVRRKTLGAWQTADTMGFFHALPELWPGWQTEVWEDRFEEHVKRCGGALRVPDLDVVAGIDSAEAWIRKRVFESFEDSPAGHIVKLAGMLAPVAPGLRGQP